MSLFRFAYTQTAVLRRCSGTNARGDIQYSDPEEIKCRFLYKQKETVGKDGTKTGSEAVLYTDTKMDPLDQVEFDGRTWTASAVAAIRTLSGEIDHWEVTL